MPKTPPIVSVEDSISAFMEFAQAQAKATEGPWYVTEDEERGRAWVFGPPTEDGFRSKTNPVALLEGPQRAEDASFVALARNTPYGLLGLALVDEVARLKAEVAALTADRPTAGR